MKRILIIGSPCSGKSRLARCLGKKLSMQVVHLDRMWWKRGRRAVTREEFDARLDSALEQECWIMDGNFQRTMDRRIQKCDAIIYLDFDRWTCLMGLCQRLLGRKGREDMPAGHKDRFDWSFVKSIWHFRDHNRPVIHTYLAKATHAKVLVLKNRSEVRAFLKAL